MIWFPGRGWKTAGGVRPTGIERKSETGGGTEATTDEDEEKPSFDGATFVSHEVRATARGHFIRNKATII